MDKSLIPILRKTIPKLIAQDIVSVQPMTIVVKPRGWRIYLASLSTKFYLWQMQAEDEDTEGGIADALEMMQKQFPGKYKIVEKYNSDRGTFELALEFDNPKEEMLWKIKWE